ncbi:hypothetical protein G7075_18965 [Phycicoccus sp. HDW14]|uniref:hypothetical protein n=1 Tax=Phycicoccus sp. HDW14 TaxID=2714941 RepID=UPI00140E0041|nr:hypothetical protein [Phycicoccus sp. HDW14]QIM22735.1 hypothetical protein G7075_18965 [Phycicoccus sp. HDW14]
MSEPAVGHPGDEPVSDRERFEDASHVLHGPAGSTAWRQLLYVLYVVALLSGLYGFTVTRAVVEQYGPAWREAGAVPPVAAGGVVLVVVVLVLAHLAGRRRGPVTPDPAWVDLVVGSSVDRWLTLRESWLVPWLTLLVAGGLVGGVGGGALVGGGATGPVALPVGLVGGLVVGGALALSWLSGQVQADPAGPGRRSVVASLGTAVRSRTALRGLGIDGLRAHGLRATRIGGAALTADTRSLRLEVASPVRRGRRWRLRPRGRWGTVLGRDLLGLRRQPLLPFGGLVLAVPGALATGWVVAGHPPVAVAVLAVVGLQLGAGLVAEGLRLHGDSLGAPPLLGGSVRGQAVAHSGMPVLLLLLAGAPVTAVTAGVLAGPVAAVGAVIAVVGVGAVLVAGLWLASFRGQPPLGAVSGGSPGLLLAWWAWPRVLSAAAGAVVLVRLARLGAGEAGLGSVALVVLVLAVLVPVADGALTRAAAAHRG